MATSAAPFGLRPINLIGGQQFVGSTRHIKIASAYAANIFYGDIVAIGTDGTIQKVTNVGTAADPFPAGTVGVFLGCSFTEPTLKYVLHSQYWPTGTVASDAMAYICDDPDALFHVQADDAVTQTMLGSNFGVNQTAGSTSIGTSKVTLDVGTRATTSTIGLRLVDFVEGPFSSIGDTYTDCIVKFNFGIHTYCNGTGVGD
tara:strand:- start:1633 stop:2235 length:603 start_codon:yes stop_codon:yes gene_type:complete